MGCAVGTAKYLVFFFNLIFFLSGIGVIIIGALMKVKTPKIGIDVEGGGSGLAILFIILGAAIAIISFFGCCGAIQNSVCMLNTFAAILIIIFIVEFAAGIAAFVKRKDISQAFEDGVYTVFKSYANDTRQHLNSSDVVESWDNVQQKLFLCCGIKSYDDYNNGTLVGGNPIPIPNSCCNTTLGECNTTPIPATKVFKQGCLKPIQDAVDVFAILIGAFGIALALVQILGIVCACCLATAVKHQN